MERQVQKEREKEEGQFNDKEAFVTEAYPFILNVTYWLRLQAVSFLLLFSPRCVTLRTESPSIFLLAGY